MSAVKPEKLLDQIAIVDMIVVDLEDVVAIERESRLSPWGRVGYLDELWNQDAMMLVARQTRTAWATDQGLIVGFATARMVTAAAELHINNIAVGLEFRRLGVGAKLLGALLRRGLAMGAATALLEVRESNAAALGLYQGFGFSVIGERPGYYSNPIENALVMRGFLPARA